MPSLTHKACSLLIKRKTVSRCSAIFSCVSNPGKFQLISLTSFIHSSISLFFPSCTCIKHSPSNSRLSVLWLFCHREYKYTKTVTAEQTAVNCFMATAHWIGVFCFGASNKARTRFGTPSKQCFAGDPTPQIEKTRSQPRFAVEVASSSAKQNRPEAGGAPAPSQAFCKAKPWRRANSFRPSM